MNSKQLAILLDNQLAVLDRISKELYEELSERCCLYLRVSDLMDELNNYITMTSGHSEMLKESTFVVQKREEK